MGVFGWSSWSTMTGEGNSENPALKEAEIIFMGVYLYLESIVHIIGQLQEQSLSQG